MFSKRFDPFTINRTPTKSIAKTPRTVPYMLGDPESLVYSNYTEVEKAIKVKADGAKIAELLRDGVEYKPEPSNLPIKIGDTSIWIGDVLQIKCTKEQEKCVDIYNQAVQSYNQGDNASALYYFIVAANKAHAYMDDQPEFQLEILNKLSLHLESMDRTDIYTLIQDLDFDKQKELLTPCLTRPELFSESPRGKFGYLSLAAKFYDISAGLSDLYAKFSGIPNERLENQQSFDALVLISAQLRKISVLKPHPSIASRVAGFFKSNETLSKHLSVPNVQEAIISDTSYEI